MTSDSDLLWGLKQSFIAYIEQSGPHLLAADPEPVNGQFRFVHTGAEGGTQHFQGWIRISAHGGALELELADPHLSLDDEGSAQLSFIDRKGGERVSVARLRPSKIIGGRRVWASYLAAGAEYLFDYTYPEGTALADVATQH